MKCKAMMVMIAGVLSLFSAQAADDPYADATVWIKGITDANGDGLMQGDELESVFANSKPWSTITMGSVNAPVVSNEIVRTPYRGGSFRANTLYFPQILTITNNTLNYGYGTVNNFKFDNITPGAGITSDSFTFMLRFRPDNTQYRTDYSWIFNWGYSSKNAGFNLGLSHAGKNMQTIVGTNKAITNKVEYQTYTLNLFKLGDSTSQPNVFPGALGNPSRGYVHGNKWHDLIVSLDGDSRKIRFLLARAPWDNDDLSELDSDSGFKLENLSYLGGQNVYTGEVAMKEGWTFKPGNSMTIGTEWQHAGTVVYTNLHSGSENSSKSFRGSIHQFAVWNRSMDVDEMKRTLAFPRGDLMRVGVQDGTSSEFKGGTETAQDDVQWTLPTSFASGDSATVTFVTQREGESEMPQMFRWYGATDSANGSIRLAVNGKTVGAQSVRPNRKSQWLVKSGMLKEGTNSVTLTRTDNAGGEVKMDAVALGGSWQVGYKNNSYFEFVYEGSGLQVRDVIDGNTFSIKRVLFGSVPYVMYDDNNNPTNTALTAHTNTVYKFTIPREFRTANYTWNLTWKDLLTSANHFPRWRLNGHDLDYTASADNKLHTLKLPGKWLMPDEENSLEIYNGGTFKKNDYYRYDYLRMEFELHDGTLLILR